MNTTILVLCILAIVLSLAIYHVLRLHLNKVQALSNDKLEFLLNNMDMGICVFDCANNKIVGCNKSLLGMFGYDDENSFIQAGVMNIFGSAVCESFETIGETPIWHEVLTSRRDKIMFWIRVGLKRMQYEGASYILMTAETVSAPKLDNNTVDTYKQVVNDMVVAHKMIVWRFSPQTQMFDVEIGNPIWNNTSFEDCCKLISVEDIGRFRKMFDDLQRGIALDDAVTLNIWDPLESKYAYFEVMITLKKDISGRVDTIYGTLKNISEKFIELHELHEYRKKMQPLLKKMGVILFDYDCLTKNIYVEESNKCKLLPLEICKAMAFSEDNEIFNEFISVSEQRQSTCMAFEVRLKLPFDSTHRWYEISYVPFAHDNDGKVTKYVGFCRNNDNWHVNGLDTVPKSKSANTETLLNSELEEHERFSKYVSEQKHDSVSVMSKSSMPSQNTTVLIVDDTLGGQTLLKSMLGTDYELICCENMPEVGRCVTEGTPFAAIINIDMESIDGFALAKCIKTKAPDTRLVALRREMQDNGLYDIFNAIVDKPIGPTKLKSALNPEPQGVQ